MGNVFSTNKEETASKRGSKRKRDDSDQDGNTTDDSSDSNLNTPKRKRIRSTSKYIYQTLFLNKENSDVTIRALGQDWRLHKLYLSQSPYFNSMFNGSWKESTMSTIDVDITDENIDSKSLYIAFGSLYKDDVVIKPVEVVGILAAATLLQLDGLIQQCCVMMSETLSHNTVCVYHTTAMTYGLEEMRKTCRSWLQRNLLLSQNLTFLKDISVNLMSELVSSPDLFVSQVEMDIYTMIKKWIFLQHTPSWSGNSKNLFSDADAFLKNKTKDSEKCYLETEEGQEYIPAFNSVRWHHVINDISSVRMLETDRLMPIGWLEPMFKHGWRHLLQVEQGQDKGPENVIEEETFDTFCTRCGRSLPKDAEYCWRWVGYNSGLDLLVSYGHRLISIKRNTHTELCPQAVSLQAHRHVCYRMTVISVDKDGKIKYSKSTGLKRISLGKDEEEIVMAVDSSVEFPIHISMNYMIISPLQGEVIPKLKMQLNNNMAVQTASVTKIKKRHFSTQTEDDQYECDIQEDNSNVEASISVCDTIGPGPSSRQAMNN